MHRYGPLAAALMLFGGAAIQARAGHEATLLWAAALITLGAWLAIESARAWRSMRDGFEGRSLDEDDADRGA